MKTLYVTSTQDFGGKTSLTISLGKRLQRDGHIIGYIKPLSTRTRQIAGQVVDRDAEFVCQELQLQDPLQDVIPITLTPSLIEEAIQKPTVERQQFQAKLSAAYERVSQGKDILFLEGGRHPLEGALFDLSSCQVADLLSAQVLVIVKYDDHLSVDTAMGLRQLYGDRLLGIVLNAVPRMYMRFVQEQARPFLEQNNLPVLAVLPQERLLLAISVQELVEHLNGQIICCPEQSNELIEYLMVGAMTASSAISYFRRRPNKAVITGGDRHDVQLAALETSTRCLILTGNHEPSAVVVARAKEVGVPIVVVEPDTLTTVQITEQIFGKTSLHQDKKVARFFNILQERFDIERFYNLVGIQT
ncbi:MAG: phosphotransacetylase family protein [Anaerolineae bacterium]|nr:phosphotransacetylase family protein [Anaerolineae bacterium]